MWVATWRSHLSISTKSLDASVCLYAFQSIVWSSLVSTGSCCIIYLTTDSHILPFTTISLPPGASFALLLLPSSSHIYLALTHPLLLIDLMSPLYAFLVSPTGFPPSFLPPSLSRFSLKEPAFTMWGFIRSA